jgi:hypothetical protein
MRWMILLFNQLLPVVLEPGQFLLPWLPILTVLSQQLCQLFPLFRLSQNTLMMILNQSDNDNQLTIFHGSSPPYTSENNSLSSHRLRDSARLNELMTLARSRDFNCSSSSAFHQPRDSMNSRKRVMGLSIFFRSSTSDRARYAKESSDVEWCPTL